MRMGLAVFLNKNIVSNFSGFALKYPANNQKIFGGASDSSSVRIEKSYSFLPMTSSVRHSSPEDIMIPGFSICIRPTGLESCVSVSRLKNEKALSKKSRFGLPS